MRILIAEDNPDVVSLLHRLLVRKGYDCRTARSCQEARRMAAAEKFDLLLADFGLPDGKGSDLLCELRTLYGLDGIALTGWNTPEIAQAITNAGFLVYLIKPVDCDKLYRAITQAVERREQSLAAKPAS